MDILSDQYHQNSIKTGTRAKRRTTLCKTRTIINSKDVKLPRNWNSFIEVDENKSNLTQFLSDELEKEVHPDGQEVVISGGFDDLEKVVSTGRNDVSHLQADHEEADPQILLHLADATNKGYERLIFQCRDTDVLLLLLAFTQQLSQEIWLKSGTKKKPRYIKVHKIKLPQEILKGSLAFQAVTGCDTTSQFTGIGKRFSWKVFHLLHKLGDDEMLKEFILSSVEQFVCRLYEPNSASTFIHEVRGAFSETEN